MKIPFHLMVLQCLTLLASHIGAAAVVRVNLDRTEQSIVMGQPLVVVLELTSPTKTTVDLGSNRVGNLRFVIGDPSGRKSTIQLPIPDFSFMDPLKIEPSFPYLQRINLAPVFTVEETGVYSISVEIIDPKDSTLSITSRNPAKVQVKPKNPSQLRSVCDALRLRIENATSATESIEATSELASIQDTVCVADMGALLARPLANAPELIHALEKIGTADAIDAMGVALGSTDTLTAGVARSTLNYIEFRTQDKDLREHARQALQTPGPPVN